MRYLTLKIILIESLYQPRTLRTTCYVSFLQTDYYTQ